MENFKFEEVEVVDMAGKISGTVIPIIIGVMAAT